MCQDELAYFMRPKLRLEIAHEIDDKACSINDVSEHLGLGESTVDKWVKWLR